MNKASRVLYILGAVFGFITAVAFLIVGVVYLAFSVKMNAPTTLEGLESYNSWIKIVAQYSGRDATTLLMDGLAGGNGALKEALAANAAQGIKYIVLGILLIAGSVVALVAKNYPGRNLPIHIVATVLNFDSLAFVGGVLGIVSAAMAMAKKPAAEEVQEPAAQPAEQPAEEEKAE